MCMRNPSLYDKPAGLLEVIKVVILTLVVAGLVFVWSFGITKIAEENAKKMKESGTIKGIQIIIEREEDVE